MLAIPPDAHVTYRFEKHKCGKARCRKCRAGGPDAGHGPYWYAYWHVATPSGGKKLTSGYVGKTRPQNAIVHQGKGSLPSKHEPAQDLVLAHD